MVLVAAGCGAAVDVRVDVSSSGTGSVTVQVDVPKVTAVQLEDLRSGLPLADLRQAGWEVNGPRPGPAGSTLVTASHSFSDVSQVPVLVADVAGSGPPGSPTRPFRLVISERKGLLEDRFKATGAVNLTCSLGCFDDSRLAQDVGYPLGAPAAQLARLLGPDPAGELTFHFELALPGHLVSAGTARRAGRALVWAPALGQSMPVVAATESVRAGVVRDLALAVAAGALVVTATAAGLLRRRRRRRVTVTGPQ